MRVTSWGPLGGCNRVWSTHTPSIAFWHLPPNSAIIGYATLSLSQSVHTLPELVMPLYLYESVQTLPELVMLLFISLNLSILCQNWLCHWRGTLHLYESVQTLPELVMPLIIFVNLSKLCQVWLCHWKGTLFICVNLSINAVSASWGICENTTASKRMRT